MAVRVILVVAAVVVLVVVLAFAGTYVTYFVAAMRQPPTSPFTIACKQVSRRSRGAVTLRFDIASAAPKDATYLNFGLFAEASKGRDLSDWGYALETRIPARGKASTTVTVAVPADYADLKFSGVRCNLINAAFADGSQQDYTADNTSFP